MWRALQTRLRAELLPPEKRNVTGTLFLAEPLARHPLVQAVAQRLCTDRAELLPFVRAISKRRPG